MRTSMTYGVKILAKLLVVDSFVRIMAFSGDRPGPELVVDLRILIFSLLFLEKFMT